MKPAWPASWLGLVWCWGGEEEDKKNVLWVLRSRYGPDQAESWKKRRCVGLLQGTTTGGKEKWLGNEDQKR